MHRLFGNLASKLHHDNALSKAMRDFSNVTRDIEDSFNKYIKSDEDNVSEKIDDYVANQVETELREYLRNIPNSEVQLRMQPHVETALKGIQTKGI